MTAESVLFALLRTAICGGELKQEIVSACTPELLIRVYSLASRHDLAHLVAHGLEKVNLPDCDILTKFKTAKSQAIFRFLRLDHGCHLICSKLEQNQIPFLPLKGAVLRGYYPEPWMRTSCDLDILVHATDIARAVSVLEKQLSYKKGESATHDVSMYAPSGVHIELHFDLVEEGRANSARKVLDKVWEAVVLQEGYHDWYLLPDAYFYVYHIAHMAKHFEVGGCGIRSFLDLWLLENSESRDINLRRILLEEAGLLQFAQAATKLSCVWFGSENPDELTQRLERFILHGGIFGSSDNRVALHQTSRGGRLAYMISRIFAPYEKLKHYYPVLENHRWLIPVMQVRRWLMLLKPSVARMAKMEWVSNARLSQKDAENVGKLLNDVGIRKSSW